MFVFPQKLPPVRGVSRTKATKKKKSKQVKIEARKPPRIKSHDFKAWDKFDVVSQSLINYITPYQLSTGYRIHMFTVYHTLLTYIQSSYRWDGFNFENSYFA